LARAPSIEQQEASVTTRVLSCLSVLALLAAAAAAAGADESAASSFVVDGGDLALAAAPASIDPCALPATPENAVTPATAPTLVASAAAAPFAVASLATAQTTPAPRALAFEYSDGYRTRLKIHKYASYATLPIFVAQYAVGQKLYNGDNSDSMGSAHKALVGATAALFAVNTVTGVWNLSEGRKDPNHKTKRMVHGLLMLAADAGFVATGVTAPHSERESNEGGFETTGGGNSQSTHRALAISSMAVATVSYLMMLFH
jgi:hypothetical protein